jgi:hypothetical protein
MSKSWSWTGALACAVLAAPCLGAETELGQGGYAPPGGRGGTGLALQWGASTEEAGRTGGGAPLYVGALASYQVASGGAVDAAAQYLLNSGRLQLLAGPRLQLGGRPFSVFAGLKAGAFWVPGLTGGVRFGLSPEAGASVRVGERLQLGLTYALDLPLGGDAARNHRAGLEVGVRF